MVLQRQTPLPIWGEAKAGSQLEIRFANQHRRTQADSAGHWRILLDPLPAGGPYQLLVKAGQEHIRFVDVLVGDVWLAVGQSNMQFELRRTQNGVQQTQAAQFPSIRLYTVPREVSYHPEPDQGGSWSTCSPATAADFSGVAYYFGKQLHQEKNVPIGLINVSWGGTPIEAYLSWEANKTLPYHRKAVEALERKPLTERYVLDRRKTTPQVPSSLFNAMINPLIPFGLKGFLYYQGEHNWNHPYRYREQLAALVTDWRIRWQQGPLPFLVVQLPANGALQNQPSEHFWSILRESQQQILHYPNTALAVAIDLGDPADLHPIRKQEVGERLALAANHLAYGQACVYSGPVFDSLRIEQQQLRLFFSQIGTGLTTLNGEPLKGFAVAGADKTFHWAVARIEGSQVVVSSEAVLHPVAVRYGWAASPICNLFNREGLPASPFRSDEWALKPDGGW